MRWLFFLMPLLYIAGTAAAAGSSSFDDTEQWLINVLANVQKNVTTKLQGDKGSEVIIYPKDDDTSCVTDGKEGKCVKPNFCDKPQEEKTQITLFDVRMGGCSHYQFQCCPEEKVRKEPEPIEQTPEGCGWSNPGGYSFRSDTDGTADFGEFPWMVALIKSQNDQFIGGGSLIHPKVVITVAHKVQFMKPKELKCRAGEWDTQTLNEILPHQERIVTKIHIHDNYEPIRAFYDAALLIMETPFVLKDAPHIGIACLARNAPPPDTLCYSMGWGSSHFNSKEHAVTLKKIQLPIVRFTTCLNQLRNTHYGSNYQLHHTITCAGGLGKDTCTGDGGSSLACPLNDGDASRYVVYGMVSHGPGCAKKNVPGLYVKISSIIDWLDQIMNDEKLDKSYIVQS